MIIATGYSHFCQCYSPMGLFPSLCLFLPACARVFVQNLVTSPLAICISHVVKGAGKNLGVRKSQSQRQSWTCQIQFHRWCCFLFAAVFVFLWVMSLFYHLVLGQRS